MTAKNEGRKEGVSSASALSNQLGNRLTSLVLLIMIPFQLLNVCLARKFRSPMISCGIVFTTVNGDDPLDRADPSEQSYIGESNCIVSTRCHSCFWLYTFL